jgi:cytochrome d ubiquinol oxidase subunit II
MIFIGSLLPALLWGVAVGNLMVGIALEADMYYRGGLLPLLNPFSLLAGLVFVALFTLHGANYLAIKTTGKIEERVKGMINKIWIAAVVLTVLLVAWAFFATDILTKPGVNGLIPALLAAVALLASGFLSRAGKYGWAFISGSLTVVFATIMVFMGLYPRLIISTLNPDWSLTITNASASTYTLQVMTIVAVIFVPIVLVYVAWSYYVFRGRISADPEELIY